MNSDENDNEFKRPNTSAFHQQKLRGWKPIITTNNLYLSFFAIGAVFIIVGSVLIYFSYKITEITYDYTDCTNSNRMKCSDVLSDSNFTANFQSCQCEVNFTLAESYKKTVYFYYGLTNFFQNHRRYVKSRDDRQLKGLVVSAVDLSEDCQPFKSFNDTVAYAPCGIIANSIFNDTFQLKFIQNNATLIDVPWSNKNIAWDSEKTVRFGEVKNWKNTIKPPNWPLSEESRSPKGYSDDEELMVWMRTAALPNFKKLHRVVSHLNNTQFFDEIPNGSYVMYINYSFPVTPFYGRKTFILSSTNYLGGKNSALGIVYLSVGTIYFSLAIAFLFINAFVSRRQSNEAWYISSQPSADGCQNETFCTVEEPHNNLSHFHHTV